jgi:hypothetical protein
VQNDILKNTLPKRWIFPPRPSMRLVRDSIAYCAEHLRQWNAISISGYHIHETAPRQLNAGLYVGDGRPTSGKPWRGGPVDRFLPSHRVIRAAGCARDFSRKYQIPGGSTHMGAEIPNSAIIRATAVCCSCAPHAQTAGS